MVNRTLSFSLFILACLLSAGMVVRHWRGVVIAHRNTALADTNARQGQGPRDIPPSLRGLLIDRSAWHIATTQEMKAALVPVQGQILAFRQADYAQAMLYRRSVHYRHVLSTEDFRNLVTERFPEFEHSRSAVFGQGWADSDGQHIDVPVIVTGQDGHPVKALYLTVREVHRYHIAGIAGEGDFFADASDPQPRYRRDVVRF